MTDFHERWGLAPRYPKLSKTTRNFWIIWLMRCIDQARQSDLDEAHCAGGLRLSTINRKNRK